MIPWAWTKLDSLNFEHMREPETHRAVRLLLPGSLTAGSSWCKTTPLQLKKNSRQGACAGQRCLAVHFQNSDWVANCIRHHGRGKADESMPDVLTVP